MFSSSLSALSRIAPDLRLFSLAYLISIYGVSAKMMHYIASTLQRVTTSFRLRMKLPWNDPNHATSVCQKKAYHSWFMCNLLPFNLWAYLPICVSKEIKGVLIKQGHHRLHLHTLGYRVDPTLRAPGPVLTLVSWPSPYASLGPVLSLVSWPPPCASLGPVLSLLSWPPPYVPPNQTPIFIFNIMLRDLTLNK